MTDDETKKIRFADNCVGIYVCSGGGIRPPHPPEKVKLDRVRSYRIGECPVCKVRIVSFVR